MIVDADLDHLTRGVPVTFFHRNVILTQLVFYAILFVWKSYCSDHIKEGEIIIPP
jgi:hypothetical protein